MARQGKPRDRSKERSWRSLLQQWRHSGQSVHDFCVARQLSEPRFYAWRRTVAKRDQQGRQRRPTDRPRPSAGTPVFVPIQVATATPVPPAALEVLLGGGQRVRVPVGFDAATLRQLLVVLEEVPSC